MEDKLRTWLTDELEQRKWSHSELARQAGLSQAVISRVLSGERKAGADFCVKVAQVLGEPPEKVLRLAEILPPLQASEGDPVLADILDNLHSMNTEQRQEALRYIQFLRQNRSGK